MTTEKEAALEEAPKHPDHRLNIGGDEVKQVLLKQVADKVVTQEQSDDVWWFFALAKTQKWSTAEAAKELGYDSGSTVWHLFHGTYGAKVDNIIAKISRYRKIYEERSSYNHLGFIETSIARRVFEVCHAALVSQSIAYLFGDPQIGKTMALEEHARRNNHGQTKYVRLPASAGVQLVAKEIARACFVSPNTSFENLRESILDSIDDRTLIIIDEAHQAFLSYQKSSQVKVFEFLRELYDRSHCGMVLCGTKVLREEIQTGKLAFMLRQIDRRGIIRVQLPDVPPKRDLDKIAAAFGLDPAEGEAAELIKDMIHTSGLGKYVKFLQAATRLAKKEEKKLSWPHVIRAHDIIAKLSKGEG